MEFEWDEAKRQTNLAKHGLDFADVETLDWKNAVIIPSRRIEIGETRFVAFGHFLGRIHAVVINHRGNATRIISFGKAKRKEIKRYEEEKKRP